MQISDGNFATTSKGKKMLSPDQWGPCPAHCGRGTPSSEDELGWVEASVGRAGQTVQRQTRRDG